MPELTAVVTLAFVIAGLPLQFNKIIPISVGLSTSAYLIRLLPIPFGIHTITLIIILFIIFTKIINVDLSQSIIASLSSFLILIVFEFTSAMIVTIVSHISYEILLSNVCIRIIVGESHVILIFILAFFLRKLLRKRTNHEFIEYK